MIAQRDWRAAGALTLAAVGLVVQAGAVSAAAVPRRVAGHGCAAVLFVGARGSGEKGPGTPGWTGHAPDDPDGLGARVGSVLERLARDLRRHRTLTVTSVRYPADSVVKLFDGHLRQYFSDLASGVRQTMSDLKIAARRCPAQPIVLAGYSQGAMIMHRVLRQLSQTAGGQEILSRVVNAVLIADGDQVPDDTGVARYGSAALNARGAGLAFRGVSHSSAVPFTWAAGSLVLSVCTRHDPVCGWTDTDLALILTGPGTLSAAAWKLIHIHLGYKGTKPVLAAADQAARDVLAAQTRWVVRKAPLPRGGQVGAGLDAITCAAAAECVGVGQYYTAHIETGLLETRSSGSWTAAGAGAPSQPAGTENFVSLNSVACASPASCVAADNYEDSSGLHGMMIAGAAKSWRAIEAPVPADDPFPAGAGVWLNSVACAGEARCVAVGQYTGTGASGRGLLLTGSGTSWHPAEAPLPGNGIVTVGGTTVSSVSCPTESSCVAIGTYATARNAGEGLLLTGSGRSWRAAQAPLPANVAASTGLTLSSVSCPSATSCVAVGSYADSGGHIDGLLLTRAGESWRAAEAPLPGGVKGSDVSINSVDCATPASCVAVGSYASVGSRAQGLILTRSGTSWRAVAVPVTGADLQAVACPAASACVAVATYNNASGVERAFAVSGARTSWKITKVPLPTGANPALDEYLDSVTCRSMTTCSAAGGYNGGGGTSQPLFFTGPA